MGRVLIVDGDDAIACPLARTLEREGYDVTWIETGHGALEHLLAAVPDIMILALALPDMDGLDVCLTARTGGFNGGILIVAAHAGEAETVRGLDAGADGYLPMPFGVAELLARVRALHRRSQGSRGGGESTTSEIPAGLWIDVAARRVTFNQREVPLTLKEFEVLALLAGRRDVVLSREDLMSQVWHEHWSGQSKKLDVTIGRLRRKFAAAGVEDRVVVVRGVGVRLDRSTPTR